MGGDKVRTIWKHIDLDRNAQGLLNKANNMGFIFTDNLEFTYNPCVEIGKLPKTQDGRSGWQGCNL